MLRAILLILALSSLALAGPVYLGQFRINTDLQSHYTSSLTNGSMTYAPTSSLSNLNYALDASGVALKASMSLDGDVAPNSYFRQVLFDGPGPIVAAQVTEQNPAGSVYSGFYDLLNKSDQASGNFQQELTYDITGTRSGVNALVYASISVFVQQCAPGFTPADGCTTLSSASKTFGVDSFLPGNAVLTVVAPYSQDYYLFQQLRVWASPADQVTTISTNPPSFDIQHYHDSQYQFSATADFSHTAAMTNMQLFDMDNNLLGNQSFSSSEGVTYPQADAVPEPATAGLMVGSLGFAALLARRKRS